MPGQEANGYDLGMFYIIILSNRNSSNTDGSFTIANSNSFLSPLEILPIAQENIYLQIFFRGRGGGGGVNFHTLPCNCML